MLRQGSDGCGNLISDDRSAASRAAFSTLQASPRLSDCAGGHEAHNCRSYYHRTPRVALVPFNLSAYNVSVLRLHMFPPRCAMSVGAKRRLKSHYIVEFTGGRAIPSMARS
jgi:hypothetical protein